MASADRPVDDAPTKIVPTSLRCKHCRHEWEATSLLGGTLEQWVAWLEQNQCPACQKQYWVEHQRPRDPESYLSLPPYQPLKPPQSRQP